jgi:hypothetical protein
MKWRIYVNASISIFFNSPEECHSQHFFLASMCFEMFDMDGHLDTLIENLVFCQMKAWPASLHENCSGDHMHSTTDGHIIHWIRIDAAETTSFAAFL